MEDLVFVTYPDPVEIEARPIEHDAVPDGSVGLGYYYRNRLIARGIVTPDAVDAIGTLLQGPVSVALAASEDDKGNIDARFCLDTTPEDPNAGCTEDCGGGGQAACYVDELPAGSYTVTIGTLSVSFDVPSVVPFGGLCDGDGA